MPDSERRYNAVTRALVYILSVLIWPFGFLIFVLFRGRDAEANAVARNAAIAASAGVVLCCGLAVVVFFLNPPSFAP